MNLRPLANSHPTTSLQRVSGDKVKMKFLKYVYLSFQKCYSLSTLNFHFHGLDPFSEDVGQLLSKEPFEFIVRHHITHRKSFRAALQNHRNDKIFSESFCHEY